MKFVAYFLVGFLLCVSYSSRQTSLLKISSNNYIKQSDTIITFFSDSLKTKNFILYGIVSHQTLEMLLFKKKYGVGFQFEGCVVTSYKNTFQKNQEIAIYLSEKFGKSWLKELPVLPLGIKN